MENKKAVYQNTANNVTPSSEVPINEAISKHPHQHNTVPQHLRLLQYGLKIPNHQQQLNSPLHLHLHQHNPQLQYQSTAHRHLQTSPQFNNVNIHPQPNQKYVHQHQQQKSPNQMFPNYHPQPTVPPPPLHPHPQMIQNTPQIWVPHQPPPIHYHHQIPNKIEGQKQTPTLQPPPINPTKPKDVVERKKSSSNTSQLRSPSAKRPPEAPVTMQGWLHKQGSEGLMLWKKRWFVLSEYCLFYYKGLEEEKLLGSILLPSYKVSICGPEDKVNKKFAFKCEHANMRTYILAADSQELMLQWIRVLNLACMLQSNIETDHILSPSEQGIVQTPTPNDNSDTNFHNNQQLKLQRNNRTTPVHMHSSSNTTDLSNQSQQELSQYNQPLYANAPPKPRRLNEGGYSSPSPDVLDRYASPQYCQPVKNNIIKPPYNYSQNMTNSQSLQQPEYMHQHNRPGKHMAHEYIFNSREHVPQNTERRTPDTYGRSKLNPAKTRQHMDYEDVYVDQSIYKRPLSPIAYNHVIKKNNPLLNPAYRAYTPVNMLGPKVQYGPPTMRKSPSTIARPHSADFLEYEINHRQANAGVLNRQQPRPKSSLDINRNTNDCDNYFYSEERYAEKMRKSAQYLQNNMPPVRHQSNSNDFLVQQVQTPIVRYAENDNTFPLMRSNTQPMNFNTMQMPQTLQQPVRSRSVLSEGSLSKELEVNMRDSPRELDHLNYQNQGSYSFPHNVRSKDYDPFLRSASARLSQNISQEDSRLIDGSTVHRDGDRKREESMKRLLEWKQRMLQSPLNRKAQGNRGFSGRPEYYHHQNQENIYGPQHHQQKYMDSGPEERRSMNNLPQYNSYSSDDEENEERSKENVHTQAGRTLDTFPSNTESLTPAHSTSTTVLNTIKEPDKPLTSMHNNSQYSTNLSNNKTTGVIEQQNTKEDEEQFTKPLKQFNKDSSTVAHVSSLRSEYSDKFERSPTVTEIKSNGALVKSILAEFEKRPEDVDTVFLQENRLAMVTPINDIELLIEENYMTMTPKKNILDPTTSCEPDAEENPYVEMTQNSNSSILNTNTLTSNLQEQQPYELVCFSEGRLEPVYMELKQPDQKKDSGLPDILLSPKRSSAGNDGNKSDSSDADDEASKDLDSLDTPNQPRFSLSDTFRPASYYLGASQAVPEFQDSSDSELVSPPPIPISPIPLEDLDECVSSTQELNSIEQGKKHDSYLQGLDNSKLSFLSLNDPDTSSMCSANTETDKRFNSSRLSNNSDSDIELRMSRGLDYERRLKRRPVSEEYCGELDSLDQTLDSVDLDRYLRDLEISNISNMSFSSQDVVRLNNSLSFGHYHEYENMFINSVSRRKSCSPKRMKEQRDDEYVRSASTTTEICGGLLRTSNCSTPSIRLSSSMDVPLVSSSYFSDRRDKSSSLFEQPAAPYYYSDLSVNTSNTECAANLLTLNNQRSTIMNGNKKDITHIVNPIKENSHAQNSTIQCPDVGDTFKLAAEARSVSVDFLNLTDKTGHIDKKNIYESDTLKRQKGLESISVPADPETRNLYPLGKGDKFNNDASVRRSHSLEGLLENVLSESIDTSTNTIDATPNEERTAVNSALEGSYLWEEDSIWRERLRSASQRHTKSMDNLDLIGDTKKNQKKSPRGITRGVTYVNDNLYNIPFQEKHKPDSEIKEDQPENPNKSEIKKENSFIIDREKLRQWDLLSSAPSDDQLSNINKASQEPRGNNTVVELRQGSCEPSENSNAQKAASGSISLNTRDTFPRAMSSKKMWPQSAQGIQSRSVTNLNKNLDNDNYGQQQHPTYFVSQSSSQQELNGENIYARKENCPVNDKMNVSAGELLGRTHEELVLLLIQLRRQSAHTLQAIENSYNEIDSIQGQLHLMDQQRRLENLKKLEQIKQHLLELEKQYEKGKPLVNLVDNMVKLGSLYRVPNDKNNLTPYLRDRLEFNQHIQERRLLAEEKRDWNRLNPNHLQLQEKVQQLYQLDKLIQEESGTLHNLQQDKEDIERALGGLRLRLNKGFSDPAEVEQARKQQIVLENELSRVHLMLAKNSKKLEETVAGNARLEQELLVLKQKLQTSRQQRSSPQFSNAGDSLPCVVGTSAMLESDLQKVQKKIGDLQKQRQELSMQVRQLTDRSNNLIQLKSASSNSLQNSQCNKRKVPTLWRETDLDTMDIIDHGDSWDNQLPTTSPLYINTDLKQSNDTDFYNRSIKSNDSTTTDDTTQNSNVPSEKQEIKTVRIVKRESERRQRDREKTTTGKWDALLEEDDSSQNSSILFRPASVSLQKNQNSSIIPQDYEVDTTNGKQISIPSSGQYSDSIRDNSSTDLSTEKSPELSPIFKSEAARQIITEMSIQEPPKQLNRRAVPKEKRRHYTAPHNNILMKSFHQLPMDDNAFDKMILNTRRARDDLDMERALRQRIDAPDVVRSTLSNKELKYNESTIDNILGTPNKINIPERYIPEQLPQLSVEEQEHRLRKVESIKKMLSDTTIISGSSKNLPSDDKKVDEVPNSIAGKATTKMIEEKKQREHLLQLNQILAKQVMEMSKIVAVKALAKLPLQPQQMYNDDEDSSPITPLPLYQQRDNFYS